MDNIINTFPTAEEIRNSDKDRYKEYLFEKELMSIFRLIIWAMNNEIDTINLMDLSDRAFQYLTEKGYVIKMMKPHYYSVSWKE